MGTVFRAADLVTGSPVAIKVLAQHHSQASDRERFLREASILASLRHPGIVSHVDHGFCAPDVPFLVMEWLTGEDLASYLGRVRLSLAQSLTLARRVAEALATAHQHGVVHRDLEPSTVRTEAAGAEADPSRPQAVAAPTAVRARARGWTERARAAVTRARRGSPPGSMCSRPR
jgi:serine/threonine protein kinase